MAMIFFMDLADEFPLILNDEIFGVARDFAIVWLFVLFEDVCVLWISIVQCDFPPPFVAVEDYYVLFWGSINILRDPFEFLIISKDSSFEGAQRDFNFSLFFQEPFPRVSCEFLRIITSSSTGFFFLFYFLLKRDSCRCSIIAKRIKSWRGFSQKNDRFEPKQSARVGINDQNNVIIDD